MPTTKSQEEIRKMSNFIRCKFVKQVKHMNHLATRHAYLLIAIIIYSCGGRDDADMRKELQKGDTLKKENIRILFGQTQILDSSNIIIYPLVLEQIYRSGSFSGSSYGGGETTSYWNLVFYNTETGTKTLLSPDQRIYISSYSIEDYPVSSSGSEAAFREGYSIKGRRIFYNVISADLNGNGNLDTDDPTYLYVSDKEGRGFRQISPDGFDIVSWKTVKGTDKVIMEGRRDDNTDKKFSEEDVEEHFIVNVNSEAKAGAVYSNAYKDSLKAKFLNS
jgi:hypothetical protein